MFVSITVYQNESIMGYKGPTGFILKGDKLRKLFNSFILWKVEIPYNK